MQHVDDDSISGGARPARLVDRRTRVVGLTAAVIAEAIFGISTSVVKWPQIAGSAIAWWRLIGSIVLWWLLLSVLRATRARPYPSAREWKLVAPGALAFGLNISLLFLAVTRTSVIHADLIGSTGPLLLIPAGYLVFGERPYWRALAWGLLVVAGLYLVLSYGAAGGAATVGGDMIAVAALLAFVAYQINSKRARLAGVDPVDFMAITMVIALLTATPVAVATGGSDMWPLSGAAWVAVALLSVGTGMVAHGLLFFAQRGVPLGTLSVIQTSQPAQSALWAWILLGESLVAAQVGGLVLVLVGMWLVVYNSSRAPALEGDDGADA